MFRISHPKLIIGSFFVLINVSLKFDRNTELLFDSCHCIQILTQFKTSLNGNQHQTMLLLDRSAFICDCYNYLEAII